MFIFRFFRWLLGYVRFTATGGFPERFINLCSINGVVLWNLKSRNGVLHACTGIKGYRAIRPAARKSGMKVRMQQKCGLPFFLHRYRRRVGLLMGVAAFFALIFILSSMIWSVRVEGNDYVRDDVIISAFEKAGLSIGTRSKGLDPQAIEREALKHLDNLQWVSLNLDGSTAIIEVREKVVAPLVEENKRPANIVAAKSGQIIILEPYNGTSVVGIGSAVHKGDLIISSSVENKDQTISFHHARGYVVARTEKTLKAEQNTTEQLFKFSGNRSHYTLNFFSFSIPIGPCFEPKKDCDEFVSKKWLEIKNIKLPISITRKMFVASSEVTVQNSNKMTLLKALNNFFDSSSSSLKSASVLEEFVQTEKNDITLVVNGSFVCHENIGLSKEIVIG
ncbi:MAG TPA: sporulation protein YqfD [Clostridia bacterium]|nr:sporulation protein YqfD [Clostridia bacterium]